jgi:hypothetical protein
MAEEPTDGRKFDVQEVVETQNGTFVVTGVQYRDDPETGEHVNFTYQIKSPEDIIEEAPAPEEQ